MNDQTTRAVIESVGDFYRTCYGQVKDLFTDEQALQSATATILINATKECSTTKALNNQLRKQISELQNKEVIPNLTEVWKFHYKDLVAELGVRIVRMIEHCVAERNYSPQEFDAHIRDYAERLRHETTEN